MLVKVYLNEGEHNFLGFDPEKAELALSHSFEISEWPGIPFGEKQVARTLEYVFEELNIGESSVLASQWRAKWLRSLSVGDVVVVGEVAYSCDRVGWSRLTTEHFANSIISNDEKETRPR